MKTIKIIAIGLLALGLSLNAKADGQDGDWGRDNIKFYPLNAFTYGGVGFGLSYERIVDKKGLIGIQLPVHLGLSSGYNSNSNYDATFMFNPGLKIYPWGQRKTTYALGTSLFMTSGKETRESWGGGPTTIMTNYNTFSTGIMINQYLQFNITENINLGFEFGAGPSYINTRKDVANNTTFSDGIDGMVLFGFHFGYRF
ncbi:MAG TPA: hypothetical protein VLZ83_08090 [Edaphocola sp.]|nr:hypothetical protein [Edaphocola sp.]